LNSIEFDTNIPLKKGEIDTRKEFLICEVCTYKLHIYIITHILLTEKTFHETKSRP
jgi:hypothetical protein